MNILPIRIIVVFSHDFRALRPAIKIAHQPRYPFEELITHRLRLDEAEQALHRVIGEGEQAH
jgi:threonine dehydrogenase-like Zn-dependent dehydrogenase